MSKVLNDLSNLAKTIKETELDPDIVKGDLDFLMQRIQKFPDYFNSVIMMETRMAVAKFTLDGETYRDLRTKLDGNRRSAHIAVTDAINQINNLSETVYHNGPIFEFSSKDNNKLDSNSIDDRDLAAYTVYGFCKEVFLDYKSRELYNELEGYSNEQRNQEVDEITKSGGMFDGKISMDDLIQMTAEEPEYDSKEEAKDEKTIDTDVCL